MTNLANTKNFVHRKNIFLDIEKEILIPKSETATIILFLQCFPQYRVKHFSANSFPDAVIVMDGKEVKVEFEYKASTFYRHYDSMNYKEGLCDLCICWKMNRDAIPIKVFELSTGKYYEPKKED